MISSHELNFANSTDSLLSSKNPSQWQWQSSLERRGSWRWIQHLLWNLKMTSGCTLHLDYIRIHQPKMIKMVSRWMIHLSDFVDVYRTHEIIGSLQYLSLTFHQKIGFCLSSTISKDRPNCHRKTLGLESQAESDFPLLRCIDFVQEEVDRAYLDTDALTRSWMFRSGRWCHVVQGGLGCLCCLVEGWSRLTWKKDSNETVGRFFLHILMNWEFVASSFF